MSVMPVSYTHLDVYKRQVLVLSGCSTKDTLKTYAYLPTMVLNGVGDIASIAKAKEK